jgi:hypothetical protein
MMPEGIQCSYASPEHVTEDSVYFSAPQDSPEASSEECPGTLYELLESRLWATYASLDRNASHEDRWRFGGSWLLLYKAIQTCPSNDSYNILRDGTQDANENMMLLGMLC